MCGQDGKRNCSLHAGPFAKVTRSHVIQHEEGLTTQVNPKLFATFAIKDRCEAPKGRRVDQTVHPYLRLSFKFLFHFGSITAFSHT